MKTISLNSRTRAVLFLLIITALAVLFVTKAWSGPDIQGRKRLLVAGLLLATAAGAFFSWLDPGDIWKRWEAMANTPVLALQDRDKLALDSLRMSREHLAHGVGVGAFEVAYPTYQTLVTELVIDFAHNDYAQFFAEAGIMGWVLAPVSIAAFFTLSFRRRRPRFQGQVGWLQLGRLSEFAESWCTASQISTSTSQPTPLGVHLQLDWRYFRIGALAKKMQSHLGVNHELISRLTRQIICDTHDVYLRGDCGGDGAFRGVSKQRRN